MDNLRTAIKFAIFLFVVITYFLLTLPLLPIYYLFPNKIRKVLNFLVHVHCKFVVKLLGINIIWDKKIDNFPKGGHLYVCNHLSYLDIFILASHFPSSYVTSMEMKNTPLLGQICILAGCVFVNRKNKRNLSNEIKEITQALKAGLNVTIFPEATSTNGEEVIRFRRPLFQAALDAKTSIVPMTLNYKRINQEDIALHNRDLLFWYGDMTFGGHFWNVLKAKHVNVSVHIEEPICSQEHNETLTLASESHSVVIKNFKPIQN